MFRLPAAALVLALATAAAAQTLPPKPPRLAMNTATAYVVAASTIDLYAAQAGQLAVEKSQDADIRALGASMVKHHGKAAAAMMRAARESRVPVPAPALDAGHAASIAELQNAAPADFDRLFLAQQVAAHQTSLALYDSFFANGDKTPIRETAKSTASATRKHLATATKLQAKTGAS